MAQTIGMPRYGANMEEGTIGEWLVCLGDKVNKGDPVAEISIEKLSNTLESTIDGVVLALLAEEGQTLSCGQPILVIGQEGETVSNKKVKTETKEEECWQVVRMPRYGANMEEGTIATWHVESGDDVEEGELIAEVAIEKLSNDLNADIGGRVHALLIEEEESVPCGTPIALIGPVDGDAVPILKRLNGENLKSIEEALGERTNPKMEEVSKKEFKGITPKARTYAEKLGVQLDGLKGSGIHGMVTRNDIRLAYEGQAAVVESTRRRMTPMEKEIAVRMLETMQTTAPSTLMRVANVDELVSSHADRKRVLSEKGIRLTFSSYFIKAVAIALSEAPQMRTTFVAPVELEVVNEVSVGVAVEVPGGLLVPVIRNADKKSISVIAGELSDLGERATKKQLASEEMTGASISITNLGVYGIQQFTPILNAPQSAILGIGSIEKRVVPDEKGLRVENAVHLSLTVDHRIVNGGPAARFLQRISELLGQPEAMFIDGEEVS